ncbi:hypothetical protein V6N11_075688 [Hibiscus sabdariffa]|uniref:Uncharacterized protein n=1 Tax=Hibiscus sabdariffa TaxID=183260 RepID=A0ABR2N6R8_9ROSI
MIATHCYWSVPDCGDKVHSPPKLPLIDHPSPTNICKEIREKHWQLNYSVIGRSGSLSCYQNYNNQSQESPHHGCQSNGTTHSLPVLATWPMPGVWWCPSWAETTMISKPRHAAKMAVATALLQKPYLQFGKHQETVDLI